jgi:two-component system chemotaxis response regulator CheB
MPKLRILIVDDSVVVRRILTDALSAEPDLEVISAAHGRIALAKLVQVNPDLVTLDMEMPELDGLSTLKELRKTHPKLPVIMFSTLTERGGAATLDALAAGANDYVTKPSNVGSVGIAISRIKDELIPKIRALCGIQQPVVSDPAPPKRKPPLPIKRGAIEVVAIGVSTGGPNALSEMLPLLPRELPVPVVIVQHMPPLFTKLLADRLSAHCSIGVKECVAGMPLVAGEAVLAAGGSHMVVQKSGAQVVVGTNMEPPQNSCRPAVDVLFRSVASVFGASSLGSS